MRRAQSKPWNYDRVIKYEKANLEQMIRLNKRFDMGYSIEIQRRKIGVLRVAKPFLVGPATIDSLINQQPESYEYVKNRKLPFNKMFFEFSEPVDMGFPLNSDRTQAIGMVLHPSGEVMTHLPKDNTYYRATIYYQVQQHIFPLDLHFDPEEKAFFSGMAGMDCNALSFQLDMEKGTFTYHKAKDAGMNLPATQMPLDRRGDYTAFFQIANLCTNLVNYINAHNVTVIRRERDINGPKFKGKKVKKKQPYYLVTIKDGMIEEPEIPTGKTWELEWRIYVRGHDRRYRDENKVIYKVIWIAPHIKGPPTAPWRHQRYQVLAQKLEREKQLYRDIT